MSAPCLFFFRVPFILPRSNRQKVAPPLGHVSTSSTSCKMLQWTWHIKRLLNKAQYIRHKLQKHMAKVTYGQSLHVKCSRNKVEFASCSNIWAIPSIKIGQLISRLGLAILLNLIRVRLIGVVTINH